MDIDLADSITDWRLSASAITADGNMGGAQSTMKVFHPFFIDFDLPVSMTRGDEITLPVTAYNYLDRSQRVMLKIKNAEWFELLEDETKQIELKSSEVARAGFRIRVLQIGNHDVEVSAAAGDVSDAVRKQVRVVSDGRREEQVHSGVLDGDVRLDIDVPRHAIDGSARSILQIYPSTFSQVVGGIDAVFRHPSGCFEQTSSATYPNVLALDYLRQIGKSNPMIESKARHYIHTGYQRLLGFEIEGGGFEWFGQPPANRTLTAYGLMEFSDMAKVHEVDPRLLARTRKWLLEQRNDDGSWSPDGQRMHHDPAQSREANLAPTAYIAWAVFGNSRAQSSASLNYLLSHRPESIRSPYLLALMCNALVSIDDNGGSADAYLPRLRSLAKRSGNDKRVWWQDQNSRRTMFYGGGRSRDVETTALAALALMKSGRSSSLTRGALSWLIEQKDAHGTWHSTHATVLALKALVRASGRPIGSNQMREIEVTVDDQVVRTIRYKSAV